MVSETALVLAVFGSTLRATLTTTVPRSNGPETAGVIDRQRQRRALVGAGEVHLAGELRRFARPGRRSRWSRPGWRPSSSAIASRRPRCRRGGGARRLGAVGDPGELAGQPRRQGRVYELQLLLAVGTRDVNPERAVGAGLGAVGCRGVAGRELPRSQRLSDRCRRRGRWTA